MWLLISAIATPPIQVRPTILRGHWGPQRGSSSTLNNTPRTHARLNIVSREINLGESTFALTSVRIDGGVILNIYADGRSMQPHLLTTSVSVTSDCEKYSTEPGHQTKAPPSRTINRCWAEVVPRSCSPREDIIETANYLFYESRFSLR